MQHILSLPAEIETYLKGLVIGQGRYAGSAFLERGAALAKRVSWTGATPTWPSRNRHGYSDILP